MFLKENYRRLQNIFRYIRKFGTFPNLIFPKKFNEKILLKILFDRNPLLTLTTDKYLVRDFVTSAIGEEHLTKLYHVVKSPREIPALTLPDKFIMKPNHLSGEVLIVNGKNKISTAQMQQTAQKWFDSNQYRVNNTWSYKNIQPVVLFEELLEFNGDVPDDYKFFCFHGEPRLMEIDRNRFKGHVRNMYDMDFNVIPMKYLYETFPEKLQKPPNYDRMVAICRKLSSRFDFVRVDLYNVNGRIVFGELTHCPGGGLDHFEPGSWDEKIGSYWDLHTIHSG